MSYIFFYLVADKIFFFYCAIIFSLVCNVSFNAMVAERITTAMLRSLLFFPVKAIRVPTCVRKSGKDVN